MKNPDAMLQPAAISVTDAALYLRVSADTVRRLIRGGLIPHARIGNSIRIRRMDLEAYLESQTSREWRRVDGRGRRIEGSPKPGD